MISPFSRKTRAIQGEQTKVKENQLEALFLHLNMHAYVSSFYRKVFARESKDACAWRFSSELNGLPPCRHRLIIIREPLQVGEIMVKNDRTLGEFAEIFETIEKRKETFGKVLLGLAFSKNDKNELNVCFGTVNFLEKKALPPKEITYNYGKVILTRKLVKVPEAFDFMRSIVENQLLKLDGWPEIPLRIYLSEKKFMQSRSHYRHILSQWPMLNAYGRIDNNTQGKFPHENLAKLGLPLFPSYAEALGVLFELHLPNQFYRPSDFYYMQFLVPDYRARIKNLRMTGKTVTLEVEAKRIAQSDILAKFYCETKNDSYISEDLPLKDGRVEFATDDEPLLVVAHIFSVIDGESIDRRYFDYWVPLREEGVIVEDIEAQLYDIIDKGENVNVEFKKKLDPKEFLETVVAFANTTGGTLFLGVDDNCRIKGFKEDAKDRIINLIAGNCDPSVPIKINSEVSIKGIPITVVRVPEGTNKPYTLKNRGIFVRRGSSDKQIQRTELDEVYEAKKKSSLTHL